jgi:hypothetical protein
MSERGLGASMPVGPPEQPYRDVLLSVDLQGVPMDQRRDVCKQLANPAHPLGRVAHSVSARHLEAPNASLLVHCRPAAELQAEGIHLATEAASWRGGEGLQVTVAGPGGGRPARLRLPVRGVPSERPPGHATVKVLGMAPQHALAGLTEVLLRCAGYRVSTPGGPWVASEHMPPFTPGGKVGRSDVIIAWVACPQGDPTLANLPRSFSMGSQPVKIDVVPAHEPIGPVGPLSAFLPQRAMYTAGVPEGQGVRQPSEGVGAGGAGSAQARGVPRPGNGNRAGTSVPEGWSGGREPQDEMPVDPPGPPQGVPADPRPERVSEEDTEMDEATGEGVTTQRGPSSGVGGPPGYAEWRGSWAGSQWGVAIDRVTTDEEAQEGVDAVAVEEAFFARFASDPTVNIWDWQGDPVLPGAVKQWLRAEGYVLSYRSSSSSEEEPPDGSQGLPGGPGRGAPAQQQQQQQQHPPGIARPLPGAMTDLPGPGRERGGAGLGSGEGAPPGGQPCRRSSRQRRQAPLPSALPSPLAPSTQASEASSSAALTRPPHPGGRGERRHP